MLDIMLFTKKKLFFYFSFLFFQSFLLGFVREFVESVNIVKVNSKKQRIVNFNTLLLEGDVEVLVDKKIHLWADYIKIDKSKQTLIAESFDKSSVVIENKDFLILADKFFLNLDNKTGFAQNLRIIFSEGYIKASRAEKLNENDWKMEDLLYTPCDAPRPHWSITASKAKLYGKKYFVRFSNLLFKAGDVPFFILPTMTLPIQNRSKSGFLLPKLSYDDDLGFGIREEFYWSIFPKCDSTIGVDWREKKGIAFLDEFRWVRAPESFTFLNGNYALEKNAFVKKSNRILQETEKRFWVGGSDFRTFNSDYLAIKNLHSLLRIDFGTDKRVGYLFFDSPDIVDDTFYNSWHLRSIMKNNMLNFIVGGNKVSRRRFSSFTDLEYKNILKTLSNDFFENKSKDYTFFRNKEIEDKVEVYKFPHLELNSAFGSIRDTLFYRHDIFIDQILARKRSTEVYYLDSRVVKEQDILGLSKSDTARFLFRGDYSFVLWFKNQMLRFYLNPVFQGTSRLKNSNVLAKKNVLESRLFSKGACRLFVSGGIDLNFPEANFENIDKNYNYYFQPILSWYFLPKFKQDHWYHSDRWDRFYPENEIALKLCNNWYFDDINLTLDLTQSYDFYSNGDIFYLRRGSEQNYLLPFKADFEISCDILKLGIKQEYSCKNLMLLQSEIGLDFCLDKFNLHLSTLYQSPNIQKARALYSDIPNFVLFGASVPLFKNTSLHYNGQFYSKKNAKVIPFEGIKPLYHSVKLQHNGHCWGIAVGFEEKMYKEYGNWKSDRAFTLSISLESLGSFSRKFKRPTINKHK